MLSVSNIVLGPKGSKKVGIIFSCVCLKYTLIITMFGAILKYSEQYLSQVYPTLANLSDWGIKSVHQKQKVTLILFFHFHTT